MLPPRSCGARSIATICAASLLGGPILLALTALVQAIQPEDTGPTLSEACLSEHTDVIECDGSLVSLIILFSLVAAVLTGPVAIANALLQSWISRHHIDGVWVAIGVSAICGLAAQLYMELWVGLTHFPLWWIPYPITGSLMGLIHWVVVTRPQRRQRLYSVRT